ncbi:uncharacterized protein LOC135198267 [Macrobrachium nipponense]|uniref:uncharacterized protein LOC135198267 n=1 Tax=Macrobrachium nipponense TaxID=159736 RepID=UPI0030C7ACCF
MTAYNPAANGMLEKGHHSLKVALMAWCTDKNWKAQLPWVLLGLRTVLKANSKESPAEKVYGEALAVLGKFFPTEPDDQDTPLRRLREIAKEFVPCWKTFTDRTQDYTPEGLETCKHIFLRDDARHPPLSIPYRGPYHVITRNSKAYLVDIHGQENWVSVDRVKLALLMDKETREEIGSCPRIPPRNKTSSEGTNVPRCSQGCPRGRTKDIPVGPPDDPTVETTQQP